MDEEIGTGDRGGVELGVLGWRGAEVGIWRHFPRAAWARSHVFWEIKMRGM